MFELHETVIFVVWSVVVWGMGWYAHKGKCEREKRAEELRLAIKGATPESTESVNYRPQADLGCSKTSQVTTSACPPWTKPENP